MGYQIDQMRVIESSLTALSFAQEDFQKLSDAEAWSSCRTKIHLEMQQGCFASVRMVVPQGRLRMPECSLHRLRPSHNALFRGSSKHARWPRLCVRQAQCQSRVGLGVTQPEISECVAIVLACLYFITQQGGNGTLVKDMSLSAQTAAKSQIAPIRRLTLGPNAQSISKGTGWPHPSRLVHCGLVGQVASIGRIARCFRLFWLSICNGLVGQKLWIARCASSHEQRGPLMWSMSRSRLSTTCWIASENAIRSGLRQCTCRAE